MINKRVLVLSNFHIQAYHIKRNKVLRDIKIDVEKDDIGELQEFLTNDLRSPVYIICNIQEETYRVENVPHTRGKDHQQLMQRKLSQLCRDASLASYKVIGREKTGRKDDKILFYSLPHHAVLDSLIDLLYEIHIPIAGIYSEPLLIKNCLANSIPNGNFLILTEIANDSDTKLSFRQCYYRDGELSLSRISTLNIDDAEDFQQDLIDELESSHHYLTSHHAMGYGETITTLILSSANTLNVLQGMQLPSDYEVQYASTSAFAKVLKLQNISDDDFFDDVLAGHVCNNHLYTKSHYRSERSNFHLRHHKLRWSMAWSAAFIAFCAVVDVSMVLNNANELKNNNINLATYISTEEQRLNKAERSIPNFDRDPRDIEASVISARSIRDQAMQPLAVMRQVAYAISAYPDFSMDTLSWEKASQQQDEPMMTPVMDPMMDPTLDPMLMTEPETTQPAYTVSLEITDNGYPDSLRAKLTRIDDFRSRLLSSERVNNIQVSQWPLNIAPEASIERTFKHGADNRSSAVFSLEFELSELTQ